MPEDRASREGLLYLKEDELRSVLRSVPISDVYCVEDTVFARGKFATVRRALHKTTGVQYAAKYIKKRRRNVNMVPEIYHEISVLLKCSSNNRVVRLYEVYETNSDIVLILGLAAGGELQRIFDGDQCLGEIEARRAMRQILEGLCFLHERNIAHLDLKPQNILLMVEDSCDDIKLCDFGISRLLEPGTEVRTLSGTPDYVAPEVVSYEPISLATDIWSVGVLAYVLLSGYTPFGADTKEQTSLNISKGIVTFEPEDFVDVSSVALDFIKSILILNPKQRPSVQELLQHPWINPQSHILPSLTLKTSSDAINLTPKSTPINQRKSLPCPPETPPTNNTRTTFNSDNLNGLINTENEEKLTSKESHRNEENPIANVQLEISTNGIQSYCDEDFSVSSHKTISHEESIASHLNEENPTKPEYYSIANEQMQINTNGIESHDEEDKISCTNNENFSVSSSNANLQENDHKLSTIIIQASIENCENFINATAEVELQTETEDAYSQTQYNEKNEECKICEDDNNEIEIELSTELQSTENNDKLESCINEVESHRNEADTQQNKRNELNLDLSTKETEFSNNFENDIVSPNDILSEASSEEIEENFYLLKPIDFHSKEDIYISEQNVNSEDDNGEHTRYTSSLHEAEDSEANFNVDTSLHKSCEDLLSDSGIVGSLEVEPDLLQLNDFNDDVEECPKCNELHACQLNKVQHEEIAEIIINVDTQLNIDTTSCEKNYLETPLEAQQEIVLPTNNNNDAKEEIFVNTYEIKKQLVFSFDCDSAFTENNDNKEDIITTKPTSTNFDETSEVACRNDSPNNSLQPIEILSNTDVSKDLEEVEYSQAEKQVFTNTYEINNDDH